MDALISLAFVAPLGALVIVTTTVSLPAREAAWVRRVMFAALALRLGLAVLFALVPSSRYFHEDADGYELIGMRLAKAWHHEAPPLRVVSELTQNFGYYYFSAGLYYLFGQLRPIASMVNCVLGTALVFYVYNTSRIFFVPLVARRAAQLAAFIPSMILWSSVAMKDTLMTLLVVLMMYHYTRLRLRFSIASLAGTVLPLLAIQPVRFYMVYILIFAIFASFLLSRGALSLSGVAKQLSVLGLIVGLMVFVGAASRVEQGADVLSLERVSEFRQGMATTANSGFSSDVDISTPGRAFAFLPIGIATLLLSPFPWQFTSLRAAFALPEMLIWWALLPALARGIRFTLHTRARVASPVLLFSLVLTVGYSLIHGNVGSGFRQRAQIFVFLFIFAAAGVFVRRCRRFGIAPEELLEPNPMGLRPSLSSAQMS